MLRSYSVAISLHSQLLTRHSTSNEGNERGMRLMVPILTSQKNLYLLEKEAEFYHLDVLCGMIARERGTFPSHHRFLAESF